TSEMMRSFLSFLLALDHLSAGALHPDPALPGCVKPMISWCFSLSVAISTACSYCRHSYTDLATVRNKEDNALIHTMVTSGTWAWIGLFQDTWEWSDLSNSSFRNWKIGLNDNVGNTCALAQVTWPGTWDMTPCDEKHPFICYDGE
uniref:C-type lectin domain-containing protein n=1 Tax=Paramormyrops kingsleyae TaxID=1676925 RepID=A0A3B3ST79_9TELE